MAGTCLPADRLEDAADSKSAVRKDQKIRYKKFFYVYAINSLSRNYIYVGLTNNIQRRFNQHNKGENKTTKPYSPFGMIYVEEFNSREDARLREKYLKSGIGKEYLKTLVK